MKVLNKSSNTHTHTHTHSAHANKESANTQDGHSKCGNWPRQFSSSERSVQS